MKKISLFQIALILILALSCTAFSCSNKKKADALPKDVPLYGFTDAGIFFVHDALVKFAEGDDPSVCSQASEFKPRKMERQGDYWVYDVQNNPKDLDKFHFYRDFPIMYYFKLGYKNNLPNAVLRNKDIFPSEELRTFPKIGYIFYTDPIYDANF